MAARISGAIVAVIAAGLLAWVIFLTFGAEEIVAPTANVTSGQSTSATVGQAPAAVTSKTVPVTGDQAAGNVANRSPAASDSPTPQQILAARTRLMGDRTQTGPEAFPPLAAGDFNLNVDRRMSPNPELPKQWLADRPGDDMLHERGSITGISSLPYKNANSFQKPEGRFWRSVHNDPVRYGGGWLLFGTIFALGFFLLVRGRVRTEEGFSGKAIKRFGGFERANHWMTATSFVLMGITGLIILYGKPLLIPIIGQGAMGPVAYWSAWLHMAFAGPFVLGIVIMLVMWVSENLPTKADWIWLKEGGGMVVPGKHPPAYRFNAGQKLLFWALTMSGLVLLGSGLALMFPFYWFGYEGMQ